MHGGGFAGTIQAFVPPLIFWRSTARTWKRYLERAPCYVLSDPVCGWNKGRGNSKELVLLWCFGWGTLQNRKKRASDEIGVRPEANRVRASEIDALYSMTKKRMGVFFFWLKLL